MVTFKFVKLACKREVSRFDPSQSSLDVGLPRLHVWISNQMQHHLT